MRALDAMLGALVTLAGCGGSLPADVPRLPAFEANQLDGEWRVLASNFPMWHDGKKTQPSFRYRSYRDDERVRLDDTVAYLVKGKRDTIEGVDTQDPKFPQHFTWRGKGILRLFSSDWVILAVGPERRWIALYFTKTLATPEGVDIISRSPTLSREDKSAIDQLLATDPFLKTKSRGLIWLPTSNTNRP